MTTNAWCYMLQCSDGSFYVGSHRGEDVGVRVAQHQAGHGGDYTARRRPVKLVWAEWFQWITDAIACERRIKGWSRRKKEALISEDWAAISAAARRRGGAPPPERPSRLAARAPQDEESGGKLHPSSRNQGEDTGGGVANSPHPEAPGRSPSLEGRRPENQHG